MGQAQQIIGITTGLITILVFLGGIVTFLFKKIVIDPLRESIDSLSTSIEGFKLTSEKRMEKIEARVDKVEDRSSRHDEQIKTLFEQQQHHVVN